MVVTESKSIMTPIRRKPNKNVTELLKKIKGANLRKKLVQGSN
jgi:hypothetical protein